MQPFIQKNLTQKPLNFRTQLSTETGSEKVVDTVSKSEMTTTQDAGIWGYDGVERGADTAILLSNGIQVGGAAYSQLCPDSENPGEWTLVGGCAYADTGVTFGPFTEGTLTDGGADWHRAVLWASSDSGLPSGILYFSIRYRTGTSGKIRVRFDDITTGDLSEYRGVIGSATITTQAAGALTIISDTYDTILGYRIITGSILFTTLTNDSKISIGPFSSDNSNIKVIGADIFESAYELPHVASVGAVVSVPHNYADATHGTKAAISAGSELKTAFYGTDGTDAKGKMVVEWTPQWATADVSGNIDILSFDGSDTGGMYYDADNSLLKVYDGTNTAEKTLAVVDGTKYSIELNYDSTGMQITIDSGTPGTKVNFAGSFPITGDEMSMAWAADHPAIIGSIKIYKEPSW